MEKTQFDEEKYYPYSEEWKETVQKKLYAVYDKATAEKKWEQINNIYVGYLEKFDRDLGGKRNFRNGVAGTYDSIAFCCLWEVCKDKISLADIENMELSLFSPSFEKLKFMDLNKPFFKRMFYLGDKISEKRGNKIDDYHMVVEPYDKGGPVKYHFTSCPVAEFTKQFSFEEVLPYLCNADYACIELLHGKLIRKYTLGNGDMCDYAICGDKDPYVREHEEYRDENGYIRNR